MPINVTFPMPNATNSGDFLNLTRYVNTELLGHTFGLTLLLIIFSITFITATRFGNKQALAFSSLTTAIFSYMFLMMELVPAFVPTMIAFLAAISVMLLYLSER